MAIAYKLTNQDLTTRNGYQWVVGEWKQTDGDGDLCGPGWLHAYTDPVLALFMNPIHADIQHPRLWEVEVDGLAKSDHGLKVGYTAMRLVKELPIVLPTTEQRVRFAIACAMTVYNEKPFRAWAQKWVEVTDRSARLAAAAAAAAAVEARSAAAAAAAEVAARSAAVAARSAEVVARSAAVAARSAAAAAAAAEAARAALDLPMLAQWAMSDSLILPLDTRLKP